MDNDGMEHSLTLQPGQMIWYESARLSHGRQRPLRGQYYDNLFVHFMPKGLWYDSEVNGAEDPVMKISAEAVRWSQRRQGPTDWSKAWRSFLSFKENEHFQRLGIGQKLDWDDDEPEPEKFVHTEP